MATWLDGIKRQDWGTSGGSWTRQPAIIVLHCTETGDHGWPGYSSGQSAPHFTIDPLTGEVRQHISMAEAARALQNPSGGVETNRGGAIQIEIIGTCDPARRGKSGWTFLPDWDDWASTAGLVARIGEACGIPIQCSVTFKAYPGSYGTSAIQRLSGSSWKSYRGICGHQHVPENSHGDPGNINVQAIMEGGDDMPSAEEVAKAVWRYDQDGATSQAWGFLQQGTAYKVWAYDQSGGTEQAWAYQKRTDAIYQDTTELTSALSKLEATVSSLEAKVAASGGLSAVWQVLLVLALLAGTVGILLATTT